MTGSVFGSSRVARDMSLAPFGGTSPSSSAVKYVPLSDPSSSVKLSGVRACGTVIGGADERGVTDPMEVEVEMEVVVPDDALRDRSRFEALMTYTSSALIPSRKQEIQECGGRPQTDQEGSIPLLFGVEVRLDVARQIVFRRLIGSEPLLWVSIDPHWLSRCLTGCRRPSSADNRFFGSSCSIALMNSFAVPRNH